MKIHQSLQHEFVGYFSLDQKFSNEIYHEGNLLEFAAYLADQGRYGDSANFLSRANSRIKG